MELYHRYITIPLIRSYSFGFNGNEKLDEAYGEGNAYDFGERIVDPRAGRLWTVDPLTRAYPWYSPYQFAGNTPIWCKDILGLQPGMFFGSENQVGAINSQNSKLKSSVINWEPRVFISLSQTIIEVQNHKKLGNKVTTIYLQGHGAPEAAFIFPGADGKITNEPGPQPESDDISLDGYKIVDWYITEKARIGAMEPGEAKDKEWASFKNNEWTQQVEEFLTLCNEVEDGGTIIFGGCNVADGDEGTKMLESLSVLVSHRIKFIASSNFQREMESKTFHYASKPEETWDVNKILDIPFTGKDQFSNPQGWSVTGNTGCEEKTGQDLQLNSSGDQMYIFTKTK